MRQIHKNYVIHNLIHQHSIGRIDLIIWPPIILTIALLAETNHYHVIEPSRCASNSSLSLWPHGCNAFNANWHCRHLETSWWEYIKFWIIAHQYRKDQFPAKRKPDWNTRDLLTILKASTHKLPLTNVPCPLCITI